MNRTIKIDSQRWLLDDVFGVEEVVVRYALPDGGLSEPARILNFERGDAVAALLLNTDQQTCVLTEQFRYPAAKRGPGWLHEIPAGMIDDGESAEDAVRREVLEETGYRLGKLMHIGALYPSPGGCSERVDIYFGLVTNADKVSAGGGTDEHEHIVVHEVPLSDIDNAFPDGQAMDGKTLYALTWLQLRLARGDLPPM